MSKPKSDNEPRPDLRLVAAEAEVYNLMRKPESNAERVKRVKVLGEEWLPDSDLLTPTSKLKRRGINARYAEQIEALYN